MDYIQKIKVLYNLPGNKNFGFNESVILEMENEHNIKIPKTLRDYYLNLGKHKNINSTFNRLLKTKDEVGFTDDKNYFVFYEENQSVVYWAIYKNDLENNNPKVYGNYDPKNSMQDWFIDADSTDGFLLSMALWNGVLGGLKFTANYSPNKSVEEKIVKTIEKNWKEINGVTNQDLRFFTNDYFEIIAMTTGLKKNVNGIYIGTNLEKNYKTILEKIDVKWDYRSDED